MTEQVRKQDIADLLENFATYVNPSGDHDPWFTVDQINQQFAWNDVPEDRLLGWLDDLVHGGVVELDPAPRRWRWRR